MRIWRMNDRLWILVLCLILFGGCADKVPDKADHCYLCEGLPYDKPCLVDLATGEVVELSHGEDTGYISITYSGSAVIRTFAGEYCEASIPRENSEVNPYYFCQDCLASIASITDGDYVLADLHDQNDIGIYEVVVGASYIIEGEVVIVTEADDTNRLLVRVTADSARNQS